MAERLTEIGLFIDEPIYIIKKWKKSAAINKLAQLEDILEKYDLEVEELEELLNDNKYAQNVVVKQLVEPQNAKNEENTWKRACELACETLKQVMGKPLWIGGNIPAPEVKDTEYFYQQAKMEGNDEN